MINISTKTQTITTDIERIIRKYYDQVYTIGQYLQDGPIQHENDNLNVPITIKEMEFVF
jgi:hypothetical protein